MNSTADLRLPFAVRPLTPNLGAEILGVKLADGISDELFKGIYQAFLRYQVLLFPPQDVPPGVQVSFARHFGEVQVHVMNMYHADGYPELYRTRGRSPGTPTAHGNASPAKRRSSTAKSFRTPEARRISATCTALMTG